MPSSPMPMMDSQRCGRLLTAMPLRVLILGGTTEASALARRIAGDTRFAPLLSLAGRTANPQPQPIATRTGGFGGIEGLVRFLRSDGIDAVVDATHPYADQMSGACRRGLPRDRRAAGVAGACPSGSAMPTTAGRSSPTPMPPPARSAPSRGACS